MNGWTFALGDSCLGPHLEDFSKILVNFHSRARTLITPWSLLSCLVSPSILAGLGGIYHAINVGVMTTVVVVLKLSIFIEGLRIEMPVEWTRRIISCCFKFCT